MAKTRNRSGMRKTRKNNKNAGKSRRRYMRRRGGANEAVSSDSHTSVNNWIMNQPRV